MTTASSLEFDEIFARTSPLGHAFSEKLTGLGGKTVWMRGFLAPAVPGKTEALVLTRRPVAVGTQGGTDDGWPDDAVFVFLASGARASALRGASPRSKASSNMDLSASRTCPPSSGCARLT